MVSQKTTYLDREPLLNPYSDFLRYSSDFPLILLKISLINISAAWPIRIMVPWSSHLLALDFLRKVTNMGESHLWGSFPVLEMELNISISSFMAYRLDVWHFQPLSSLVQVLYCILSLWLLSKLLMSWCRDHHLTSLQDSVFDRRQRDSADKFPFVLLSPVYPGLFPICRSHRPLRSPFFVSKVLQSLCVDITNVNDQ